MALVKWGLEDDEEQKDPFALPTIQTVQSVQDSWQPAGNNAAVTGQSTNIFDQEQSDQSQEGNYLLSDQKAKVDQQLAEQRAQEEAARAEAARVAAESENARRRAAAAAELAAQNQQEEQPATKYTQPEQKDEGLWGLIKGIGAGIQQGAVAVGDVAVQGGGVLDYLGQRMRGVDEGTAAQNVTKSTGAIRDWLHSGKDITGRNFVGTTDVEEQAGRIANGTATLQDYVAVGGKGLQVGLDSTMFLNPARMAAGAVPLRETARSATMLGRVASNPALRYAMRDAGFYGGLQGVATTGQQYGQTGDLEEALKAGTTDAIIGGVVQGGLDLGGSALNKGYKALLPAGNKLRGAAPNSGEFRIGDEVVDIVEQGATNPERQTPTAAPVEDGNISFERQLEGSELGQPSGVLDNAELTPVGRDFDETRPTGEPQFEPIADGIAQPVVEPAPVLPEQIAEPTPSPVDTVNLDEVVPAQTPQAPAGNVRPVSDGTVQSGAPVPVREQNMPTIRSEEIRNLQEARAGKTQAEEAEINQRLQQEQNAVPAENSLPDEMDTPITGVDTEGAPLTREQVAQRLMPKLDDNSDVKQRIATAAGMEKDVESPVREILAAGGVKDKQGERIASLYDDLEKQLREYNTRQEANQKAYAQGGDDALSSEISRERSRITRDMGKTSRRLVRAIDKLEGSRDMKVRLVNDLTAAIGTRNANILTSAGLLERNITQELTANAKLFLKNPVKMTQSTFNNGNVIKDTAKGELSNWGDAPNGVVDAFKYVIGNTYRTAMIPTTTLANTRRGMYRDELTKWAYKELEGRNLSSKEAHKLAGTAGNEMEALVNTFIGVDNGMTNRGQAMEALKAWKEYIRTGDSGAKAKFLEKVEAHSSLADQMISGLSKEDATRLRGLKAVGNLIFPFVRTATNLMKTTARQDLHPFAKSLVDEIKKDQRSGYANAALTIKSKLIDYGIMSGAVALASSGVLAYNDGDEVDKPRGWSIKIGDNKYIPVRATAAELPMALAGASQQMFEDVQAGKPREWQYYAGMVTGSLPYIDQFNQTTGAIDSLTSGEDAGYAAKSYGVNMAKSLVPFSNNSLIPYVDGKQGKSTNVKTTYDQDLFQWLYNSVRSSYDPEFRNSLRDSRDNAGRVRTVDNQGLISNKTMNDPNTALYNDDIDDLVAYAREAGLGNGTQEMFNTYDTGKNNNFKSVQDAITFLDVEDGGKPDNAKKLEQNGKLANLAQQIRDGFYGDTGSELLTIDGKELKSDVSVPNSTGSKNSKLPLSMQSIKNAIAQTDLGSDANNQLFEISNQKSELYNQLKSKAISYEQYSAAKAGLEQTEIGLLSGSENYQKMVSLMDELDRTGFFDEGGIGSTKSGQTYLWNSLNALLGSKGATPAANYPEDSKGFTPWGRRGGTGRSANSGAKAGSTDGIKWTPAGKRQMASVQSKGYTPVNIKVKLGNEIRKNKTQNYSDRTF